MGQTFGRGETERVAIVGLFFTPAPRVPWQLWSLLALRGLPQRHFLGRSDLGDWFRGLLSVVVKGVGLGRFFGLGVISVLPVLGNLLKERGHFIFEPIPEVDKRRVLIAAYRQGVLKKPLLVPLPHLLGIKRSLNSTSR